MLEHPVIHALMLIIFAVALIGLCAFLAGLAGVVVVSAIKSVIKEMRL